MSVRLKNCYIVKDYNKEKKIVACKICNTHSKVKNKDLNAFVCCTSEKWSLESEYNQYRNNAKEDNRVWQVSLDDK